MCSVITNLVIYWVICINAGCRTERRVGHTCTHTHTYTPIHTHIPSLTHTHEERWYSLGGGSRRGLFELLPWVLATEGASEVGEMHVFVYTHKLSCCTYMPHNSHSSHTHTVTPKQMVKQAVCALTLSLVRTPKQLRDTAIDMHLSVINNKQISMDETSE